MRNSVVLMVIVISSHTTLKAQKLFPDSGDTVPSDQLSMVLPPEGAVKATIRDSVPSPYPWYNDSTLVLVGTYTVIVTEPNPCVDTSIHVTFADNPYIVFTDPWMSYPWTIPTADDWFGGCWGGCLVPAPDPYKGWHEIDLFSDDTMHFSSISGFEPTHKGLVSTKAPEETPESPKPVPVPEQPWYQALLPNPIRVKKS